ncbi:phage tail protein, partial [Xenorhabdus sp. 12]
MSTKYFSLLTHAGTDKLKKAASSGIKLEITHMAVGDGNGNLPIPDANQSKLVNEKYRAEIDSLTIDPTNHNLIVTEHFIPEGNGNWWVREIGLFDKEGTLIAIGNCGEVYKPESLEQMIRMALPIDDHSLMEWIGLISGIATRQYVRNKIKDHANSRNHPDATLKEKGLVALSNEINSNNETHAATPKAVKTAYELADKAYKLAETVVSTDKYVPVTRKINGKELIHDVKLGASDVNAYNKQETDGLIQPVKVQAEDAMKLAETAKKNAEVAVIQVEKKVPLSRKINGKDLANDIELTASDVNAYSKQETDDLLQPVRVLSEDAMKLAETTNSNATTGIDNATKAINDLTTAVDEMKVALDGKVPLTRKINGKDLVHDVELTAS